jgi:hypothetical protein
MRASDLGVRGIQFFVTGLYAERSESGGRTRQIGSPNVYVGEVDGAARTQKFLRYVATGCTGTGSAEVGNYLE